MKPYIKPSFEFIELRIEERLARCYMNDMPNEQDTSVPNSAAGVSLPGGHPGCMYHCPHS